MKKINNILIGVALLVTLVTGCKTSEVDKAGKSLATVAQTVDSAMKGWATWVAQGNSNEQEEAKVKALYTKYQSTMAIARNAYSAVAIEGTPESKQIFSNILIALAASQSDILNLINSFQQKGAK